MSMADKPIIVIIDRSTGKEYRWDGPEVGGWQ